MNEPSNSSTKEGGKSPNQAGQQSELPDSDGGFGFEEVSETIIGVVLLGVAQLIGNEFPNCGTALTAIGLILLVHIIKLRCEKRWGKRIWFGRTAVLLSLVIVAILALILCVRYQRVHEQLDVLIPGNKPLPAIRDDKWVSIRVGGNNISTSRTNVLPIIRFNGTNLLSIRFTELGARLSGDFRNKDGKVVAIIETNRFVFGRESLDPKQPNSHTLIVKDQENIEVLNICYLNRYEFYIRGVVRTPDGGRIEMNDDGIVVNAVGSKELRFVGFNFRNVPAVIDIKGSRITIGAEAPNELTAKRLGLTNASIPILKW